MNGAKHWIAIVALGFAMLGNFSMAIWWTSKLDSRVLALEEWMKRTSPVTEMVIRMETQMMVQRNTLDRIENRLESVQRVVDRHVGEK